MVEHTLHALLEGMGPSELQAIISNLDEALVVVDPQGNFVMANPAALAMFGYQTFEEPPGRMAEHYEIVEVYDSQGRLIPPEERPASRALRGETFSACELRFFQTDTGRSWTGMCSGAPVLDRYDNVALGVVTIRDISGQKHAEAALARERDNLLNVLETMPDPVYILDQEYNIQFLNAAMRAIFGPADGRKCYEFFHGRSEVCPFCRNAEVFAGKAVRWEWYSPRTQQTLDRMATPLRNPDGTIFKLEIFRDVTDRKQAEERLRQLQAELAHVDRLKTMGEMGAGLAHEINQPLTAILVQAELAGRRLELGQTLSVERLKRTWKHIAEQAFRAGEIIRRLRGLVRKSDPVQAPLDFRGLVDEVLSLLHSDLECRDIRPTLDLAPPLPQIVADKIQVQQVLLNLVRNAIDAMEDTPVARRALAIRARPRGRLLEISVSDTGCGIRADDLERLFSAFHTTKTNGTGLGLAICRSIVELHGGHIRAAPNGDRGTVFTLTLPIAKHAG